MLEHIYPAFKRGRILKNELLCALRDHTYSALYMNYLGYSDGIIKGCRLKVDGMSILIGPGLIKCQEFVFMIKEEQEVAYTHEGQFVSLKFRIAEKTDYDDYVQYKTEFFLDEKMELSCNEMELCRFKLKEGSVLRDRYVGFYDIQTEYDTINLTSATWAGLGGCTLSKQITDMFADEVLHSKSLDSFEVQFAYLCKLSDETVPKKVICDFLERRFPDYDASNALLPELFDKLVWILEELRGDIKNRDQTGWDSVDMVIVD